MNEVLELSSDINVITAEINSYKQIAGQVIFEIGRRLKGVRDNPQKYGLSDYRDWERWCNEEVDMSRTYANQFIKITEELENSGFRNLSVKALYQIATLPQEEREKEHTLSNSETKKVDEIPDMQNFAERDGNTRDKVAEQIGLGSGEQYRKAKFIFENADEEMINLLDEKKISIHKAYVTLKEQLNEKERLLKQLEENNNKLKQDNEKLGQLLTEERNKPQESATVEV